MGSRASGQVEFAWDGINDNGEYVQPGKYQVTVTAQRGDTNEVLQTQLYNRVNSVAMGSGINGLTLNLEGSGQIPFNQVTAIQ